MAPCSSSTHHLTFADRQRAWAERQRLDLDEAGRVHDPDANLLEPLSAAAREELGRSLTQPLGADGKPGALHVLHSAAALRCNVFDYWRDREPAPLLAACGLEPGPLRIEFAAGGLAPPPHPGIELDVLLHGPVAAPTAVVGGPPAGSDEEADAQGNPKLPEAAALWRGLPACRALALDVSANPNRYRRVDVGRLLTQALCMTTAHGPRGFRMLYLWHDADDPASREHRRELDRIRMRIGGDVALRVSSWQTLIRGLVQHAPDHGRYTDYLVSRYLSDPVDVSTTRPGQRNEGTEPPC